MRTNEGLDMQRVWKEFGKNTEAGKLLYDIYGVKYKPEDHIKYPKLILKTPEMKERERLEKERLKQQKQNKLKKASNGIDYSQGLRHYQKNRYIPYGEVDYMPHRKNQKQIEYEMKGLKQEINNAHVKNVQNFQSRQDQIAKLQDKFEYQERTVMPKGARLPGLQYDEEEKKKQMSQIHNNMAYDMVKKNDKRAELERLYNNVIQEIDDRYKHMSDMKALGKNVDNEMMGEIKERIQDMKNIEKMIEEYDEMNKKK